MLAGSFFDGDKGYSFFNKRVILRMAQGENMSWNGSVMRLSGYYDEQKTRITINLSSEIFLLKQELSPA